MVDNISFVITMAGQISLVLKFHIRIFCFCTVSFGNRAIAEERLLCMWSFFLLIAFNVVTFTALIKHRYFLFFEDKFGFFNDVLKIVCGNVAVTISYLETLLQRSHSYKFWGIYLRLQERSANKSHQNSWRNCFAELHKHRRFLVLFYTVVAAEIYVMYICFSITVVDFQAVLFWCIYTPFIYVIHLRNLQFIFFVELIRLRLVAVQKDLIKLVEFANFGTSNKHFEEILRSKIANAQQSYQLTFEMFQHFHNSFGFSMVAVILVIYVRILVNTYFSYYSDNKGWEYYGMSMQLVPQYQVHKLFFYFSLGFILLIPSLLQCPMILITSKCCMNTVRVFF